MQVTVYRKHFLNVINTTEVYIRVQNCIPIQISANNYQDNASKIRYKNKTLKTFTRFYQNK